MSSIVPNGKNTGELGLNSEALQEFVRTLRGDADIKDKAVGQLVRRLLSGDGQAEHIAEKIALDRFKGQYDRLGGYQREKLGWEELSGRLTAEDGKKIKLAMAMQGGGSLFGIREDGKGLIMDRGPYPVKYGVAPDGKIVRIYDNDEEQISKLAKVNKGTRELPVGATYEEIRKDVLSDGYVLFPCGDCERADSPENEEIVLANTSLLSHGLYSANEYIGGTYLESGTNPEKVTVANLEDAGRFWHLHQMNPETRRLMYGVFRLLEV